MAKKRNNKKGRDQNDDQPAPSKSRFVDLSNEKKKEKKSNRK